MFDPHRNQLVSSAKMVVVKVGSRVLTASDGTLDLARVEHLADQISLLHDQGRSVVLVSSGAVAAGIRPLGLSDRPNDVATLQAVAAVGQTKLIEAYDRFFKRNRRIAAQILLTAEDLDDRLRYLNLRNTLRSVLEFGAIPIVNENDTISVDELQTTFGDNDRLAGLVTNILQANVLVILSDIDGLYDGPPNETSSQIIHHVERVNNSIIDLAVDRKTGLGKGGMLTKLKAAQMVTSAGENVILASGYTERVLERVFSGENLGTFFAAADRSVSPYKRWLGFSAQPRGKIVLDKGATKHVVGNGSSILAIGIVDVVGEFAKGDVVSVVDHEGVERARGLSNYTSAELNLIKGVRSDRIAEKLGHCPYETVVHRDNLFVTPND